MIHLAIIIVNYKTPHLVTDCLGSLLQQLENTDSQVIVVDNASRDESCKILTQWLLDNNAGQRVRIVESPTNTGFAGGNNIGIESCKAKYYLLLNSDTLLRPGAIETLLDTAESMPNAGLISPRLESLTGDGQSSCFRHHTPLSEFSVAAKTGFIDKFLSDYIVAMPPQESPIEPQWTSFACILIRKEVFDDVGLLDEGYFMYFEDAEFCDRASRAGWGIYHNPGAAVVHFHSGSSGIGEMDKRKKRLPRYYYESRSRFFFQRYGILGLFSANIMWLLGRSISLMRQLSGRSDKSANDKEWLDIWTNFTRPQGRAG